MPFTPPSRRLVVACELATAAWSFYTVVLLYAEPRSPPLVSVADRVLEAAAALLIASAVWKRRAWAPTGVVVFAAYVGIPTLIRVVATVHTWVGPLASSYGWFDTGELVQKIAQLVALAGGVYELMFHRSAA